jgi:2-polyprenyl-6-methoxyphenol hydroxylase-like FAD-dependent oxidoreductase
MQRKMTAPTIAIIGAGPCGLTLARLFDCKGIDYVVYERDESPESNRTGGSLDIHGEAGQLALRECGLFDKFTQSARYEDTVFAIADKTGEPVIEIGQGRDAPEVDRAELRRILLGSVPKHKIKWGHVLKAVTVGDGNKPVLRFTNHVVLSGFKLVVGCDGAWSKVRSVVRLQLPSLRKPDMILLTASCRSQRSLLSIPERASSYRQSDIPIPCTR